MSRLSVAAKQRNKNPVAIFGCGVFFCQRAMKATLCLSLLAVPHLVLAESVTLSNGFKVQANKGSVTVFPPAATTTSASPLPSPTATPSPSPLLLPTPTPTVIPMPTPMAPQTGSVPIGATITPQWMDHLSGYWHSSRLGNSPAIDDQKASLQIAISNPFQHKAVLDFWGRTNVDPETSNLNIKFPVRTWSSAVGNHNDYVGHTVNLGAMQWTCEAANTAIFTGTYGYFDFIKTPGQWEHIVCTWDYDAKTFAITMNGVVAHDGPFTGVNFGAADRDQYDMQLVVANPTSGACLPTGSYFDVRDDYSLTGN